MLEKKKNNTMFRNPDDDTSENRYMVNQMARHTMRVKLLADIQKDMLICKLEGWDEMEYIHQLQDLLNSFNHAGGDEIGCERVSGAIPESETQN